MLKIKRRPKREIIEDYQWDCRPKKKLLRLRYLLALVFTVGVFTVFLNDANAEAQVPSPQIENITEPQSWREEDAQAGQLLIRGQQAGLYSSAVLQSSEVHFDISGLVAKVVLKQTFTNDSDDWVEGLYVFPLPDAAAVNQMSIHIGERAIYGEIKERAVAKEMYRAAKIRGEKAALVEHERPNMFTSSVANIPPGESIIVELVYLQTIEYDSGQFGLRFPMTITPRYIPGVPLRSAGANNERNHSGDDQTLSTQENDVLAAIEPGIGWAFNTDQVTDASRITPLLNPRRPTVSNLINPITITATINAGMPLNTIESAYHTVLLSRQGDQYALRLKQGAVSMEQDFVLHWEPVVGHEPAAAVFSETVGGEDYSLLMVLPPSFQRSELRLAKEVIYIIDTSGSMDGVSIRQAKSALLMAVNQLQPGDRFNIIEFNSKTFALFPSSVMADALHLAKARKYVSGIQSGGGTEMLPALQAALYTDNSNDAVHNTVNGKAANFVRQVIFITDGAVGNEQALFKEIKQNLGNSRLFTVGIGSAPNSFFMRKAAQFGRGSFTYIGNVDEVQEIMLGLFNTLDKPMMSDITVDWPQGANAEVYPQNLPDLYQGEPLIITARTAELDGVVSVKGQIAGKKWRRDIPVKNTAQLSGISTLWARYKISELLDGKAAGRSDDDVRADVIPVALRHQLLSPYTSFIAVENVVSRPTTELLDETVVSNARPKGQSVQQFAYPRTATRGAQSALWALMFLMMSAAVIFAIRQEPDCELTA
ncbi:MAG: marine proteobacterial sortase target protein [Oceanicoccus sp.]